MINEILLSFFHIDWWVIFYSYAKLHSNNSKENESFSTIVRNALILGTIFFPAHILEHHPGILSETMYQFFEVYTLFYVLFLFYSMYVGYKNTPMEKKKYSIGVSVAYLVAVGVFKAAGTGLNSDDRNTHIEESRDLHWQLVHILVHRCTHTMLFLQYKLSQSSSSSKME